MKQDYVSRKQISEFLLNLNHFKFRSLESRVYCIRFFAASNRFNLNSERCMSLNLVLFKIKKKSENLRPESILSTSEVHWHQLELVLDTVLVAVSQLDERLLALGLSILSGLLRFVSGLQQGCSRAEQGDCRTSVFDYMRRST